VEETEVTNLYIVALHRTGIGGRWRELKVVGGARRKMPASGHFTGDFELAEGVEPGGEGEWIEVAFGLSTSPKAGFPCVHIRILGDRCVQRSDVIHANYHVNGNADSTVGGADTGPNGVVRELVGGPQAITAWLHSQIAKAPAIYTVLPARR
jgi:hypothetical protein